VSALDRLFEFAPVGLVPLAWTFAALAGYTTLLSPRALRIGLGVMCLLFVAFAAHPEMSGPALGAWRRVIAVGFVVTAAALVALLAAPALAPPLGRVAVAAWLAAPAYGLWRTGRALDVDDRRYDAFAACTLAGALPVLAGAVPGSPAVGLGGVALGGAAQTASIADAAVRQARD
jgi:hypothetical protein